jgi:hypothetical protein
MDAGAADLYTFLLRYLILPAQMNNRSDGILDTGYWILDAGYLIKCKINLLPMIAGAGKFSYIYFKTN